MKLFNSDTIPLIKGKKILDLGCGIGGSLEYGVEGSLGIDCDKESIKKARKFGRNVIYGKLPNAVFNGKFDAAILSHVLEHLPTLDDVQKTLELARAHLKKGGLLIVGTPYAYDSTAWQGWQHQRVFTMQSLTDLIKMQGFEIVDVYTYWHLPCENWWMKHGIGNYPLKLTKLDYILKVLATFNLTRHLTVVAKR